MQVERVTDPDDSCPDNAYHDGAPPHIGVSSLMRNRKTCSFTVPYCTFGRPRGGPPGCGAPQAATRARRVQAQITQRDLS